MSSETSVSQMLSTDSSGNLTTGIITGTITPSWNNTVYYQYWCAKHGWLSYVCNCSPCEKSGCCESHDKEKISRIIEIIEEYETENNELLVRVLKEAIK